MRNISASLTTDQILASVAAVREGKPPVKDVTRRLGWQNVKVGERLQVCKKCMGRKPGEPLVKLAVIEVVSVRREPLIQIMHDSDYARAECRREGFPKMSPVDFIHFFCESHKDCEPEDIITRIEFKYVITWRVRHKPTGKWLWHKHHQDMMICSGPTHSTFICALVPCEQHPKLRPSEWPNREEAMRAMVTATFGIKNLELVPFSGETEIPTTVGSTPCCERDHNRDGNCDRHPA